MQLIAIESNSAETLVLKVSRPAGISERVNVPAGCLLENRDVAVELRQCRHLASETQGDVPSHHPHCLTAHPHVIATLIASASVGDASTTLG